MFTFHQLLAVSKNMEFPLGWDKDGFFRKADLSELNHLLISGATGTGKSVFVDSLLLNLLAHNGPEKIQLILCDTKSSEFSVFADSKQLFLPVANHLNDISAALGIAFYESQDRLKAFAKTGVRDIDSFNDLVWERFGKELPHIVLVVDDLSLLVNHRAYAHTLTYLRQILSNGRAAGIHFVAVTQMPAAKKMKGISSHFPAKLVFPTSSNTELCFLAGKKIAEFPKGKGNALFVYGGSCFAVQVTSPVKSDFYAVLGGRNLHMIEEPPGNLIDAAAEIVVETRQAIPQVLQQRLRIGYDQAIYLLRQLEELGLISTGNSSVPRKVLVTKAEWNAAVQQIEQGE